MRLLLLSPIAAVMLGTLLSAASPADVLFHDDFSDPTYSQSMWSFCYPERWSFVEGALRLRVPGPFTDTRAFAGDPGWSDYTLSGRFRGGHTVMLHFRVNDEWGCGEDEADCYQMTLQLPVARNNVYLLFVSGEHHYYLWPERTYPIDPFRWHVFEIHVYGPTVRLMLDGEEILYEDDLTHYSRGRISMGGAYPGVIEFDDICVTDDQEPSAAEPATWGGVKGLYR